MSNNNNANNANNANNENNAKKATQKKPKKRSAAAQARRTAKWASHKASKKASALEERNAKRERVMTMFPDVLGIVGAQGFMPNIRKVKGTSKAIKTALNTVPLFQDADRATIYPGWPRGRTLLGHYIETADDAKALETLNKGVPKRVLENPLSNGRTPLEEAYETDNFLLFAKLLEKGADPNTIIKNAYVSMPILTHIAGDSSRLESDSILYVKTLVKYGAKVNKLDTNDLSPLDYTLIRRKGVALERPGANTIAKFLIDAGAAVETPNKHGFTALLTAITKNNREIFAYMMNKGNVNIDKQTGTNILFPLKMATLNGSTEMLEEVLNREPKHINAKDAAGNTALHYAVMTNALEKISLLKTAGADPKISNKDGKSAMNIAQALEAGGDARAYNLLKE